MTKSQTNISRRKLLSYASLGLAISPLISFVSRADTRKYYDGRPQARLRMDAKDHGIVLRHGDGLNDCDLLGARDVLKCPHSLAAGLLGFPYFT